MRVDAYLQRHRYDLAVRAAEGYPGAARIAGTPLLAVPRWLPGTPVPLDGIRLNLRPDAPPPRVTDAAAINPALFPRRSDGTSYARHCDVIRELAAPAMFENRAVYRLTGADLAGGDPHLEFSLGRYFDAIDVGGAAAHEYAAAEHGPCEPAPREPAPCGRVTRGGQDLRAAVGDPCDLAARPAALAVSVLTLRYDRDAGTASFPLHYRDPALVGHAGGLYQVIPVGVFQPSGEAPWNAGNDFSLWRGMLREYAEEFLGDDEEHGSETAPIDYANWPFARRMTDALARGRIRAWCLGIGTDPLTFATDLLTAVVIDAPLYDGLFAGAVAANAEGTVLVPRPFDDQSVSRLLGAYSFQAAGAALLSLALAHRQTLLGALPTALALGGEARALGAERGVGAACRVHPGAAGSRPKRRAAPLSSLSRGLETWGDSSSGADHRLHHPAQRGGAALQMERRRRRRARMPPRTPRPSRCPRQDHLTPTAGSRSIRKELLKCCTRSGWRAGAAARSPRARSCGRYRLFAWTAGVPDARARDQARRGFRAAGERAGCSSPGSGARERVPRERLAAGSPDLARPRRCQRDRQASPPRAGSACP